jgi:dihydroorotate dehydrogenase
MDLVRKGFDLTYDLIKPSVFYFTQNDPKKAHEFFVSFCRHLYNSGLEKFVLDNNSNYKNPGFELSNAAGFNKDGQFHPIILKFLGFDRVVVGTVTGDFWQGNPKSIVRFPETSSMVNWEGLHGTGVEVVARQLENYGDHGIPITINFMSTPGKEGDELLRDQEKTIRVTRNVPYVDRYELNISCPNTKGKDGKDERKRNLGMLDSMLCMADENLLPHQKLGLKVSPDSTEADVKDTLETARNHRVNWIVTTNTTTNHNPLYILNSPGKGGASGNAVYEDSLRVQKLYQSWIKELGLDLKLIAVGGINSPERVQERLDYGATGIQIYTSLVFKGPELLRGLRSHSYN